MAEMAIDSLSKPPATERIRCAGRIDMKKVVAAAAVAEPDASQHRRPVKAVATAPKPAGMKTHTSLSDTSKRYLLMKVWSPHAVSCRPGYVVEPT